MPIPIRTNTGEVLDREAILAIAADPRRSTEVAADHGLTRAQVKGIRKRYRKVLPRAVKRPAGRPLKLTESDAEVVAYITSALRSGLTLGETAAQLGVAPSSLRRRLYRQGLGSDLQPLRKRGPRSRALDPSLCD